MLPITMTRILDYIQGSLHGRSSLCKTVAMPACSDLATSYWHFYGACCLDASTDSHQSQAPRTTYNTSRRPIFLYIYRMLPPARRKPGLLALHRLTAHECTQAQQLHLHKTSASYLRHAYYVQGQRVSQLCTQPHRANLFAMHTRSPHQLFQCGKDELDEGCGYR